ncbi:MAG: hypothetical protein H6609_06040 [Ignavibacteriales bacterium]|nr:hypothetical protein [Ignavibacteriales bacterium]
MLNRIFLLLIVIGNCRIYSQNMYITNDLNYNTILDSSGIYVENCKFNPDNLFPKNEWKGKWIWLNKTDYPDHQETFSTWINNDPSKNIKYRALFRKNFFVNELPEIAVLNISGDVSYRAYLNNKLVAVGPPNIGSDYEDQNPPTHWFFTSHNILNNLEIGENILAVEVFSFDLVLSETTSGKGKLICDINSSLNQTLVSTDSTWKCKLDTSYGNIQNNFSFNTNEEAINWTNANYDDEDWSASSIIDKPIAGYLTQSKIPIPFRRKINPKTIILKSNNNDIMLSENEFLTKRFYDSEIVLDFGKNRAGYYNFSLIANKNDTLKITPIEKNRANRPFMFICKDGKNVFSIPYLNVFRYLKLEASSEKGLNVNSFDVEYSSYPTTYSGSFNCSDEFYTQLWDVIRNTTQMCMQSLYLDSPLHQEPIACTGDYLIETLSNYYAFGDKWLARQDILKTAKMLEKNNYDMFHTSYSLLWVQWISDYYKYTADKILIDELIPHVNNLNKLFATYLDENYLLTQAPDYMFMDWIKIDNFNAHHPPAVIGTGYLTAFYYKSLIESAKLNELVGNNKQKDENLSLAKKIKYAINKYLWDDQKKLYKDGIPFLSKVKKHFWLPEDEDIVTYSPHVNTLAVLYDIAPKERQETIMDYVVIQDKIELQPYFTYYVLSAINHVNKFSTVGLNLLDKWKNGIDLETYTLKENWQNETEFGYVGDYSHAWGGSPLFFMSSVILGIKPEEPGYKKIRFTPFVSDNLTWAKGKIPIDSNNIVDVDWERQENNYFICRIKIPESFSVMLNTPKELQTYSLQINGVIQENNNNIYLDNGNYLIEYKKN